MAACPNVVYGMWTNGIERFCYRRVDNDGVVAFDEIPDIPGKGRSEDEVERPRFDQLKAALSDALLFAFRRCHNYIAGNQGPPETGGLLGAAQGHLLQDPRRTVVPGGRVLRNLEGTRWPATAGVKWLVIGQFENVARKGDGGPVPSRHAAKKTVIQRDTEEDARRSPALPLRPFSCTFGTALTWPERSFEGEKTPR